MLLAIYKKPQTELYAICTGLSYIGQLKDNRDGDSKKGNEKVCCTGSTLLIVHFPFCELKQKRKVSFTPIDDNFTSIAQVKLRRIKN